MTETVPETTLAVAGDAHARGVAQGRAHGAAVAAHRAALLDALGRAGIADPELYVAGLITDTRFGEAIEAYMPHLMREVEGIAEGAGLPRDAVYALQLLDEEWAYRGRVHRPRPIQKCSSFAIHRPDENRSWIGQNMDVGPYTEEFQRVVVHSPADGRPGALVLTITGVLALLGVNDRGVGVCVNSLPQLPSADHGVPVAFMIRQVLEASSAAEAADRCRRLPHATNQHYLIADPTRVVSLECSAAGVTEYHAPDPDRVLHTNHPLAGEGVDRYPAGEPNSVARLRSLEGRLSSGNATAEVLRAALSAFDNPANPVCRLAGSEGVISFTTGSMITALTAGDAAIESVVMQFLGESVLVTAVAMLVALAAVELLLPVFNGFLDADLHLDYFGANGVLLPIAALVLLVGLAAGLYPAFYLARFEPARILKANKSAADAQGSGRLCNALVVGQFAVSIGLIICTTVIYAQTVYARTSHAGYERDGLLQIGGLGFKGVGGRDTQVVEQIRRIGGVRSAARTQISVNPGNNSVSEVFLPGSTKPIDLGQYAVETDFFRSMGMKVIAGRDFSDAIGRDDATTPFPVDKADEQRFAQRGQNIVVTAEGARRLGFRTPQEAIGKELRAQLTLPEFGLVPMTIVGVVEPASARSANRCSRSSTLCSATASAT